MRGQRMPPDERNGEIDEEFWAQAAARTEEDGDEGQFVPLPLAKECSMVNIALL
jgi:hypothetical protein